MLRGLTVLESHTVRQLLQYSSRARALHTLHLPICLGECSRAVTLGRRSFTSSTIRRQATEVELVPSDDLVTRIAKRIGPRSKTRFNAPPEPLPKHVILQKLEEELSDWLTCSERKLNRLDKRIVQWGIRGACLDNLVETKRKAEPSTFKQPFPSTMRSLMQIWSKEAIANLQQDDSSTEYFDLENARHAYQAEGIESFARLLTTSFLKWIESNIEGQPGAGQVFAHIQSLLSIMDSRFPSLKHSEARMIVRQIHLHVGPTNSGKTHGALLALCKANTGVYAGPLRLLAHEVWERINTGTVSPGIAPRTCNLKTGEEMRMVDEHAGLTACTVEMVNYNQMVDVAVIDEIQMIGDQQRGHAWTNAVLGIPAKELHLCGENSVISLIQSLAQACGDVVHIHEYERLTPLAIGPSLDGQISNIEKGDCIVAFSRTEIFRLKQEIETKTSFKCAVAYGALPPETKSEQAKKFNDPDNDVSIMVASDAIGMGLNLKIKRIVFSSVNKWSGKEMIPVSSSQLKQIAGRAGRFGTNTGDEKEGGLATTWNKEDLQVVGEALAAPLVPITRAGYQATFDTLHALVTTLPDKKSTDPLSTKSTRKLALLLEDAALLSQYNSRLFFAASMQDQFDGASFLEDAIPSYRNMSIEERELFALAPANRRDEKLMALLANMVGYYARGVLINFDNAESSLNMLSELRKVEGIRSDLDKRAMSQQGERHDNHLGFILDSLRIKLDIHNLMTLESLHRGLTLYLWFSNRLPLAFCYTKQVEDYKKRTEVAIDFCLEAIKAERQQRLSLIPKQRLGQDWKKGRSKGKKPFASYMDKHVKSNYKKADQSDL